MNLVSIEIELNFNRSRIYLSNFMEKRIFHLNFLMITFLHLSFCLRAPNSHIDKFEVLSFSIILYNLYFTVCRSTRCFAVTHVRMIFGSTWIASAIVVHAYLHTYMLSCCHKLVISIFCCICHS